MLTDLLVVAILERRVVPWDQLSDSESEPDLEADPESQPELEPDLEAALAAFNNLTLDERREALQGETELNQLRRGIDGILNSLHSLCTLPGFLESDPRNPQEAAKSGGSTLVSGKERCDYIEG